MTWDRSPTQDLSVQKPESGTYGEQAELDRLAAGTETAPDPVASPGSGPGGLPPLPPLPPPGGMSPGFSGVPDVVLGPGDAPAAPMSPQVTREEAQITLLAQLAVSPDVSEQTREWARLVLEMITDDFAG